MRHTLRKAPTPGESSESRPRARVVYTQPPLILGEILKREGDGWLVRVADEECIASPDAAVDPLLLEEMARHGGRVVLETTDGKLRIAGVLTTSRTLLINREGVVDATVASFRVTAQREVLLRAPGAFARIVGDEVELYGQQVVARARGLARILARMIKLN